VPRYALRKLLLLVPLVWAVLSVSFLLLELAPGDASAVLVPPGATAQVRQDIITKWDLEAPAHQRYLKLVGNALQGDFGTSVVRERPVFTLIVQAMPYSLALLAGALLVTMACGVGLGTLQALQRGRLLDRAGTVLSLLFFSLPSFWLALVLVLVFAWWIPLLPSSQAADPMAEFMSPAGRLLDRLRHLLLPALALGLANAAAVARYQRASLLEVLGRDYLRAARAKGLSARQALLRHALPNALLPIFALLGMALPFLFSGSVVVERVFAWPGMGSLIFQAIIKQDTPLVLGCFFVYTLLVALGGLLADLLCAAVDPRIRLS